MTFRKRCLFPNFEVRYIFYNSWKHLSEQFAFIFSGRKGNRSSLLSWNSIQQIFYIKLSSIAQFCRERLVLAACSFHGDSAVDPGPRSNKHALLLTAQGRAPWIRTGLSFSHSISSGRGAGALYSQESDRMFILHIKKFRLNQPTPALGRRILAPLRGRAEMLF